MGQRNMQYSSHMVDMEAEQRGQDYIHPEPCVFYGSMSNFPQNNVHAMVQAPGNAGNFNLRHLQEHQEGALFYGMSQYNGVQHQHPATNVDLAIATSSNHYNPYMAPPSATRDFPVPVNHGVHDQLPFLGTHRVVGVPTDSYGRNNLYVDGARGPFKRKNAEGIPGSIQYCDSLVGSSSSVAPMSGRPLETDVTLMDATFVPPEYVGNDSSSFIEGGPHISARNRPSIIGPDPVVAHNVSHLIQGNYVGPAFQLPGNPWVDPQFGSNGSEVETFTWNQAALPYLHGNIRGGCVEAGNMGTQGFQVTASNGNSSTFLHPPIPQGHPNIHHPPLPVQGFRGHNIGFPSQMAMTSRRLSASGSSNTIASPFQGVMEGGPRYLGPVPPSGFRLYRPHRREVGPETNTRQRNLPHLRVLPEDGVAMLEIPAYHEVGDSVDQHRDMRLDIDHMSYEELLALGEQIGSVGTGLSEETIASHLKTKSFVSSTSPLEETECLDQELDFCVICQTDYKDQEKIGMLDCGHEYHVDCVRKWLIVKNTCPICKSTALSTKSKDL